ncbi:MAG: T9SS type A sorting domain-containing protein [Luteibaculaceae bacterium]
MKRYIVLITTIFCLFNSNIFSQNIYGNNYEKLYYGFHSPGSPFFTLNYYPVTENMPPEDNIEVDYYFTVGYGSFELEYFPTEGNIWQIGYGNKTDISNYTGQFNTWNTLVPSIKYIITDTISPYLQNIEHSVKLKLDTTMYHISFPMIHDLNVSLALGDTLFIEVGNDNLVLGEDSAIMTYAFSKGTDFNDINVSLLDGSPEYWAYNFNIDAGLDNRSAFPDYYTTFNLFKIGYESIYPNMEWELNSTLGINYIKLTLKSGENNISNAGVSFGGFCFEQSFIYLSTNDKIKNKINNIVYPNPVQEIIYFREEIKNIDLIEIIDLTGKRVAIFNDLNNVTQLNLSNLKPGMYFVRLYKGSKIIRTEKVLKQ